ncbi:MAG: hypothetical protein HY860_00925 [Chlamydiales bacterium]|nr:hypothetical protein [Chlamydiales bacterium]
MDRGIETFTNRHGKQALISLFIEKGRQLYDATHDAAKRDSRIQELGSSNLMLLETICKKINSRNPPSAQQILNALPKSRLDELLKI